MNNKTKLSGVIKQYASGEGKDKIKEIVVIDGYTVCFAGLFSDFYSNADVNMTLYRAKLLKTEVKSHTYKRSNQMLIVFIQSENDAEQ